MKRVLFVDDEPMVLRALSNVFRRDKARWEMLFASAGEAGLALLAIAPVDVVVTDMRMPGMDGATFLERVEALYPATRRIILSGYSDPSAIAPGLRSAHHVLEKPCPTDVLRRAIEGDA
jgi:YesN/AraC family two-component response regulator